MAPPAPRTPLRRVSQGSLFRLSRSSSRASTARHGESSAPAGLEFLPPALAELCDEVPITLSTLIQCTVSNIYIDKAESLSAAAGQLAGLGRSLAEFNDAFASWMYIQGMNSLCVEWSEVRNISSQVDCRANRCIVRRQTKHHLRWPGAAPCVPLKKRRHV